MTMIDLSDLNPKDAKFLAGLVTARVSKQFARGDFYHPGYVKQNKALVAKWNALHERLEARSVVETILEPINKVLAEQSLDELLRELAATRARATPPGILHDAGTRCYELGFTHGRHAESRDES